MQTGMINFFTVLQFTVKLLGEAPIHIKKYNTWLSHHKYTVFLLTTTKNFSLVMVKCRVLLLSCFSDAPKIFFFGVCRPSYPLHQFMMTWRDCSSFPQCSNVHAFGTQTNLESPQTIYFYFSGNVKHRLSSSTGTF